MEESKIAEEIRAQRQKRGISQEAMGFHLNISQAAYSKMERGESEITITRIYEIADILEISVFDLLPKSKYGTSINLFGLKSAWLRFKNFFSSGKRMKRLEDKNSTEDIQ